MKLVLKIVGVLLLTVVVVGVGVYVWASRTSDRMLARQFEIHNVYFPIPFPLLETERAALDISGPEQAQYEMEQAVERGKHLVEARYGCSECHGANFGGGVMMDAPPIGRLLGPNITGGAGSRALGFGPADWDRIVRHGVRSDGRPSAMPSEDFQLMSDQELSDIVAYLSTVPPVVNQVPPVTLGPIGKLLMATGSLPLSVDLITSHDVTHALVPPEAEVSVEFGRHLTGVCTGCHRADLAGGPIKAGDPSWAPARNLTPHQEGLGGWSYDDFVRAMREGRRPDGTELLAPMSLMMPYAERMTEVEMEAMWTYLQSVPPVASR